MHTQLRNIMPMEGPPSAAGAVRCSLSTTVIFCENRQGSSLSVSCVDHFANRWVEGRRQLVGLPDTFNDHLVSNHNPDWPGPQTLACLSSPSSYDHDLPARRYHLLPYAGPSVSCFSEGDPTSISRITRQSRSVVIQCINKNERTLSHHPFEFLS